MAKELSWFRPGGVPTLLTDMLARHLDQETVEMLTGIFGGTPSAGYASADLLRQYRNLLHPTVCLKEGIQPIKETGMRATYFCLVAYAALNWTPEPSGAAAEFTLS